MIIAFVKEKILNAQRCILIVTHDNRIFGFGDRLATMSDGRVVGVEVPTAATH